MFRLIANFFKSTPSFKGKLRLAKWLTEIFIDPSRERILRLKDGTSFKVPNIVENLSFELFVNGTYEKDLVSFLITKIPKNGVFLDVGANIGAIAIPVAAKRPDISIYSFEASGRLTSYLKENISRNKLKNVHVVNKAVHSVDLMNMDFYSPADKFGKGSLAPVFTQEKETVQTVRLDTFMKEKSITPSYIKIDVEGFEYYVIDSLGSCFKNVGHKPIIIFEFVDWAEKSAPVQEPGAAQARLLQEGYTLFDFDEFCKEIRNPIASAIKTGSRELIGIPTQV